MAKLSCKIAGWQSYREKLEQNGCSSGSPLFRGFAVVAEDAEALMVGRIIKERVGLAGDGDNVVHDGGGTNQSSDFAIRKDLSGMADLGLGRPISAKWKPPFEVDDILLPLAVIAAVGGGAAKEAVLAMVVAAMRGAELLRGKRGAAGIVAGTLGLGGH